MDKNNSGFTLIELLVAVTIGLMLILVTTGSLRMGFSLMKNTSAKIDANVNNQAARSFFTKQIASISLSGSTSHLFIAKNDFVSFASPLSLYDYYDNGFIIAYYSVKKNRQKLFDLVYGETILLPDEDANPFELYPEISLKAKPKELRLLNSYDRISVEYLVYEEEDDLKAGFKETKKGLRTKPPGKKDGVSVWVKKWPKGQPTRAIKLTLLKNGMTEEIIAPVMASSLL